MAEKEIKKMLGVYQRETGSFTYGGVRFIPGKAMEVPAELSGRLAKGAAPVRFFATPAQADEELARLKKQFAKPERKK